MNLLYVKLIAGAVLLLGVFYSGWHTRDVDFMAFKREVEVIAKVQEAKIESITKQQALVTKGIKDEYDAKLTAVRNYYKSTSMWNNTSGSKVSGISAAPSISDVVTSYNVLAGQCAETTQQIVSLQSWLNEQMGIK